MPINANQELRRAKVFAKRGAFDNARRHYQEVLKQYPENKRAKDGLRALPAASFGVTSHLDAQIKILLALHSENKFEEAYTHGIKLAEKNSNVPVIHNILGVISSSLGKPDDAIASFRRAVEINPDYASAFVSLGNVLNSNGEHDEAIVSFNKALAIDPGLAEAHNSLASIFRSTGRHEDALRSFSIVVKLKPSSAGAYANLGNTLYDLGKYKEAVAQFRRALNLDPNFAAVHYGLGNALNAMGESAKAITCLEKAIEASPDFAGAYINLGATQQKIGMTCEAVANFQKALDIDPTMSTAHNNLGNAFRAVGQTKEAIASYQSAIECEPNIAEYYRNLSGLIKYTRDDPRMKPMESMYLSAGISGGQKMHLGFALGKANDDIEEYDTAFDYFSEANLLRKSAYGYDIATDINDFNAIKLLFESKAAAIDELTVPDVGSVQPIFVVGMPRSGTTLVEQILSSHSKVYGAGELAILSDIIRPIIDKKIEHPNFQIARDQLVEIRQSYIEGLEKIGADERVIVDKLPLNFQYIGFVALAFPEAKIINLNRDPQAICWSIFKSYFSTEGNGFAYDLVDLAKFYNLYQDMMTFWCKEFPDRIYDLGYEALTENQESETRKLLEFCGLDWEEECLNFHKTKRFVLTASAAQVRQQMYTGSSAAWRKYEKHLQPLISALQR